MIIFAQRAVIWAVNPTTQAVSALPITGLDGPALLAYMQASNSLIIVNIGDGTIAGNPHTIIQFNLTTRAKTTYTDNLLVPSGIVAVPGQNAVYISDEDGNYNTDETVNGYGAIWKFDFTSSGLQTTPIAQGTPTNPGDFDHSVDLALDASGNILVANTGNPRDSVTGSLFRVSPSGQQTWIVQGPHQDGSSGGGSGFGAFSGTDSVELGSNGLPYIGEIQASTNSPAQILEVIGSSYSTLVTGATATDPSAPPLSSVEGMRTYQAVATPVGTSSAVSSSSNPSVYGQSINFTATVTAADGSTPTGSVQFFVDGAVFGGPVSLNSSGQAASGFTTTLSAGQHTVTASYTATGNYQDSSGSLTQTVNASTTTAVSSSQNPSTAGQDLTFTATVTANNGTTPTGSVQFAVDGSPLGSAVSLNGSGVAVSMSDSSLSAGPHTVTATYSPSANSFFLTSTGMLTQQVNNPTATGTTTTVSSSATNNSSVFGQSVMFTATVTPKSGSTNPTGSVQFSFDGTPLGSPVTLSNGVAVSQAISTLSVTTHVIQAAYSPTGNFSSSTGQLTLTVNKASTSTTVTSSGSPAQQGSPVTFTATISVQSPGSTAGGNPTGTVTFTDTINGQTTTLGGGPQSLTSGDNGVISIQVSNLAVGTHSITASYSGDGNFSPSSGSLPNGQTVTSTSAINDDLGLLLLDPAGSGSLMVTGNASVAVNGRGSVVVDSNHAQAAVLTGHGMVTAADIDVTGGTQTTGQAGFSGPIDHEPAIADPLGYALPSPPSPTFTAVNYSSSTPLTLQPGTYIGGIKVSGQGSVTLAPGVYYLQGGGFSVSGKGSVTGTGVVIINAPAESQDTISISGQGTVTLSAPTAGAFQGIALFQASSSSNPVSLNGPATLTLTGVLYVPGAPVSVSGNARVTINPGPGTAASSAVLGALIAYDLTVDGNGALIINPDDPPGGASALGESSPLPSLSLPASSAQRADGSNPLPIPVPWSAAKKGGTYQAAVDQLFSSDGGATRAGLTGEGSGSQLHRSLASGLDSMTGELADELGS